MSEQLVVDIDSKDAEVAVRNLDRLTQAAEQMGKAFANSKGATSALRELRLMLTGIKGQGSALDELTSAVKGLNSTSDSLKKSFNSSIRSLGDTIKREMEQTRAVMFTSGVAMGKAAVQGLDEGMSGGVTAVKRQGKTLAAAAKAEATRVYEAMVAGQANAKIKDVGALFKLAEAGATLSPYHKQVLDNWKASSAETYKAMKAQLAAERVQMENAVKAENKALQDSLKRLEDESKNRASSLSEIYEGSLARGKQNIARVKSNLKTERVQIANTVKEENAALQAALKAMDDASANRATSLATIYRDSLGRGNFAVAQVKSKLKAEASELKTAVATEEAALQAALQAMEAADKTRLSSLADIYAGSLVRGKQSIARVKAQLKEQADEVIQANETELKRVRAQVAAATNSPQGLYQKFNAQSGIAGPVVDPAKIGQVNQLSKAFKQLTIDGNDAHSMARGLASGFNLLWLTWGNLAPLFAGASISFGLKKTFDIGSEVEYQIKMMETLGQTTQTQGRVIREALREIDQTTQFSLTELSQAMVRLGQSGKSPKEALEILRPAADLASVGMVDLKTSTDLLIQTQALFGKSTADVGKIAAQVFEITKSGVLNVEDIGDSMKYASEANTRFGKSVEETLAILGGLAQANLKGAIGGTAYINFLRDLNGRSGPAINAMKELEKATGKTIKVFDEAGKQRSAIDIFEDIAAAADMLKAKDADKLLANLFSDRGGRAFFAMIRDGNIKLRETVDILKKSDPNKLFMAAKGLMDTTKGALNVLQGALVGALDRVFEVNEVKFKTFITDITAVISSPEFANSVHGMVAAVGSLYDSIKTLLPVLTTLGTAWLVFKAGAMGVAIFQGLATAIAGMAPVLGLTGTALIRNTGALVASTAAWQANGVAMVGNVAASRAAAAGIDAVGVAAARTAATASVAGVGMRGLAVVIGFLANPIVGIITTLGLLGAAFWSAKSDAEGAMNGTTNSVIKNGQLNISQWNEEIKKLRERNALMGGVYTPLEDELGKLRANQKKLEDDAKAQRDKVNAFGGKALTFAQAQEIQKLNNLVARQVQGQKDINKAALDLSKLRAEDRNKEIDADLKRQRTIKGQGDLSVPPTQPFGADRRTYRDVKLNADNELAEMVKRNNIDRTEAQRLADDKKAILEAQHKSQLISEGDYQSQLFALTRSAEQEELDRMRSFAQSYKAEAVKREDAIREAISEARARPVKNAADRDAQSQNIAALENDLKSVLNTADTVMDGIDSDMTKLTSKMSRDMQVASYTAMGNIKKLQDTEKKYWADDKATLEKAKALDAVNERYAVINESILSNDAANKAADLAAAESLAKHIAHIDELQLKLGEAEASAQAFWDAAMARGGFDSGEFEVWKRLKQQADVTRKAIEDGTGAAASSSSEAGRAAFERVRKEQNSKLAGDLSEAVMTGLTEGSEAGKKRVRDILVAELKKPVKMVIDLAMNATVNGIFGTVSNVLSGGAGGGGGGILGTASNAASAYNAYNGFTTGTGMYGKIGSALGFGASSSPYAFTSVGSYAAPTGTAMLNAPALGAPSSGFAAMAGPLAVVASVGALIGNAMGVFKSYERKDTGLTGTLGNGNIESFDTWRRGGSLFSGPKYDYRNPSEMIAALEKTLADMKASGASDNALSEFELEQLKPVKDMYKDMLANTQVQSKSIQTAYDLLRTNVGDMADIVGISSDSVRNFTMSLGNKVINSETGALGLSFQNLTAEEISKKIAEALDTANNKLAEQIIGKWENVTRTVVEKTGATYDGPDLLSNNYSRTEVSEAVYVASPYAKEGEKAIDTLTRLATSLKTVNGLWDSFGYTLLEASLAGGDAASQIADRFGGLESMVTNFNAVYQAFYTENERAESSIRSMVKAVQAVGIEMPTTSEQFRDALATQVALGEGGAKAANALLAISGTFAEVSQMLIEQQKTFAQNYKTAAERNAVTAADAAKALQAGGMDVSSTSILNATRQSVRAFVDNIAAQFGENSAQYRLVVQQANAISDLYDPLEDTAGGAKNAAEALEELANATAKLLTSASNARDTAGSAMDKLAGAAGFQGDGYARIREARLWEQMATAPWETQISLASELTDLVVARYDVEKQAAEDQLEFVKGLRDYVKSLMTGDLSPLTNAQKLSQAQDTYLTTLAAARRGDTDAQGKLEGASSEYLQLARNYYASSETYTGIFNSVTSALSALGNSVEASANASKDSGTLAQMTELYNLLQRNYQTADSQVKIQTKILTDQLTELAKLSGGVAKVNEILATLPNDVSGSAGNTVIANVAKQYTSLMSQVGISSDASGIAHTLKYGSTQELQQGYDAARNALITQAQRAELDALWSAVSQYRGIDGSHAAGLEYVPFDGYRAELHKGERVLTAQESRMYGSSAGEDNSELIAELQTMREENARLTAILADVITRTSTANAERVVQGVTSTAERAAYAKQMESKATIR